MSSRRNWSRYTSRVECRTLAQLARELVPQGDPPIPIGDLRSYRRGALIEHLRLPAGGIKPNPWRGWYHHDEMRRGCRRREQA